MIRMMIVIRTMNNENLEKYRILDINNKNSESSSDHISNYSHDKNYDSD